MVSIWPKPDDYNSFASLVRENNFEGRLPVFYFFQTLPMMLRYLGRLVVDTSHERERIRLQIDVVLEALQQVLMHVVQTHRPSIFAVILRALHESSHIAQMVELKTDAHCSPLIPLDVLQSYRSVLMSIGAVGSLLQFQVTFIKLPRETWGQHDPMKLVKMLHEDLDVLAKLFWVIPKQYAGPHEIRRRSSGTSSEDEKRLTF